jgi:hypothetical protein
MALETANRSKDKDCQSWAHGYTYLPILNDSHPLYLDTLQTPLMPLISLSMAWSLTTLQKWRTATALHSCNNHTVFQTWKAHEAEGDHRHLAVTPQ